MYLYLYRINITADHGNSINTRKPHHLAINKEFQRQLTFTCEIIKNYNITTNNDNININSNNMNLNYIKSNNNNNNNINNNSTIQLCMSDEFHIFKTESILFDDYDGNYIYILLICINLYI